MARKERNLDNLSDLGHFLKGSSATLGLIKVKDSCEKIQHFGARKDETGQRSEPDDDVSLRNLNREIEQAQKAYKDAERALREFFEPNGESSN